MNEQISYPLAAVLEEIKNDLKELKLSVENKVSDLDTRVRTLEQDRAVSRAAESSTRWIFGILLTGLTIVINAALRILGH